MILNQVQTGDALTLLKTLPPCSIHTIVTSPPYWNLRSYLPDKTVVLRSDLSVDEKKWIEEELKKRGIKPIM